MAANALLAGAAGTLALEAYTYADMAIRGRPASEVPPNVIQRLAQSVRLGALANKEGDAPKNRRSGTSALLGYGIGMGAASAYARLRPSVPWLPWQVGGLILGAATLVASEGSATALGATDWSEWSLTDWISDIVPRSLFGLVTAYVCEEKEDVRVQRVVFEDVVMTELLEA
jgi:hypothetical protein